MPGRWRGGLIPALLLVAWEVGARTGLLPHDTMSSPAAIMVAGWDALRDGSLLRATLETFETALLGLAIGTVIGVALGLPLGMSRVLDAVVSPTLDAIRPVPAVALIPLALLIYGFGVRMEVMVIAFACIWPVLIVAVAAVRGIDPRLVDIARMLEMNRPRRIAMIVLPATLARIGVGVRVSAGVALVVAVTIEIVVNPQGLGYGMMAAAQTLNPDLMWAELLWVGLVGWGFSALLLTAERRWLGRFGAAPAP